MRLVALAGLGTKGAALMAALASNVARRGHRLLGDLRREMELNDQEFAASVGVLLAVTELGLFL